MLKYFNRYTLQFLNSLMLMLVLLLFLASPAIAKQIEVGRVLMATQGVTAEQPGIKPRTLARRSAVFLGDTLKTPEGGRAQLRMADGEMISLTAASELKIEAFDYQPDNQEVKDTNVKRLVTGGLRTITGAVKGEGYEMKSRAGTIGIRGTAFEMYSQQGENLYVRIQRGNVFVANAQGSVDIGVNQRLMAARIGGINQAPESISLSDLPQFFEDAFAEDTTLSLATGGEQQQVSQQNQISEASYNQPPAPAMALQVAQTTVVSNFDDTERDFEKFKEPSEPNDNTPEPPITEPEPPKPNFSGYVAGMSIILEDDNDPEEGMQLQSGYFEQGITKTGSGPIINFSGKNGKNTLGVPVNNFNFTNATKHGLLNLEEYMFNLEDYAGSNIDEESNNSGLWYKFSLGDADIYNGIHYCAEQCTDKKSDSGIYSYAFSNKVLEYNDLSNISKVLGNKEYTYNLIPNRFGFEGLDPKSNMKVNFVKSTIDVSLKTYSQSSYNGSGTIKEFYNDAIHLHLNNQVNNQGEIKGRFVGSEADGAITTYLLSNENDTINGIAVFERTNKVVP